MTRTPVELALGEQRLYTFADMLIYLDTSAARPLARLNRTHPVPADLTSAMVISPLTLMELCCQLTVIDPTDVREAFDALKLLSDIATGEKLMPKTNEVIALLYGVRSTDLPVEPMALAIYYQALQAASPQDMQLLARQVKDDIDKQKTQITRMIKSHTEKLRKMKKQPTIDEFRREFGQELGARVGLRVYRVGSAELSKDKLSAYFEYRTELNRRAAASQQFNFTKPKNLNDIWDAEQLVYLCLPELRFITCDGGYAAIKSQSDRIHVFKPSEFGKAEVYSALMNLLT